MKARLVYEVYRKNHSIIRRTEKLTFPRGLIGKIHITMKKNSCTT